ncbi:hypothetical protein QE152_g4822 [Popillia japonica]|uniref:Uncharacterized protein n=1 Tax=Popillia japonica TaxID=7064 RepID=A0AAW1N165_POPJA
MHSLTMWWMALILNKTILRIEDAFIDYVVDGIIDEELNKTILYGAKSIEELEEKLKQYEKPKEKQSREQRKSPENKPKQTKLEEKLKQYEKPKEKQSREQRKSPENKPKQTRKEQLATKIKRDEYNETINALEHEKKSLKAEVHDLSEEKKSYKKQLNEFALEIDARVDEWKKN